MQTLLTLPLLHDQDVVVARQRAAQISQCLGFDAPEQTRVATAVSEIARNAFQHATGATVCFGIDEEGRPQHLVIRVADNGPGIPHLADVLNGRLPAAAEAAGGGITRTGRLVDAFRIDSSPAGTTVELRKRLPRRQEIMTAERARQLAAVLARRRPQGLIEEIQAQNRALLRTLDELQQKQQELLRLNRELEDTNRGVVALYAELDEKADHLRRADELKSRFLSNMTHEFRTPVNSIIGLSTLLLEDRRLAGREPEPEITYIRQAAEQLSELVNDLLDLARVEAGKTVVRPVEFEVGTLFGALRGMLRPLLLNESVSLVFDPPDGLGPLVTDEAKVSQIVRNLISNALKFTERGEVRVSAASLGESAIRIDVSDTGIGIAAEDQERIFDEFTQLDHQLQVRTRGTGLGLPLSRRLAELLGGRLEVRSQPGTGSTFTLTLPVRYAPPLPELDDRDWPLEADGLPLLVVDPEPDTQYFYTKVLRTSAYKVYAVGTVVEAEAALQRIEPAAIVMDVAADENAAWNLLVRLRRHDRTARTPVVIASAHASHQKAFALGADACLVKPVTRTVLLDTLADLQARTSPPLRVLLIDDEEIARYLVRQCLPVPAFDVRDASSGAEGLRRARQDHPDVILLDLVMPDLAGTDVLRQLRADPVTSAIPVLILTSQAPGAAERAALLRDADALLSKAHVSRGSLGDSIRAARAGRSGAAGGHPPARRLR